METKNLRSDQYSLAALEAVSHQPEVRDGIKYLTSAETKSVGGGKTVNITGFVVSTASIGKIG